MKGITLPLVAALFLLTACNKPTASAPSPQQAAERVQQAYATADDVMTKQAVANLSDSMKKGDFEQAVVSLTTIRARPATTPEQQQAIIQSAQAIEMNLINRMNAGDKNAERAYQLLKELKRN
jgi:outer membrane protein assembly factor BamD (BamD/ComL family)